MEIFLGYPSEHTTRAEEVHAFLQSLNLDVWFDRAKIVGGDDFRREREEAQKRAGLVVYLFSEEILSRAGEIQRELKQVLRDAEAQPAGSTYLVPLRVSDVKIPPEFEKLHYLNLFEPTWKLNLCRSILKRYEKTKDKPPAQLVSYVASLIDHGGKNQKIISKTLPQGTLEADYFRYNDPGEYFEFINSSIEALVWRSYYGSLGDFSNFNGDMGIPWYWALRLEEFFREGQIISLRAFQSDFMGGAHGNSSVSTKNFCGEDGGSFSLSELFAHNSDVLKHLIKYVETDVNRQFLASNKEDLNLNIREWINKDDDGSLWEVLKNFNFDRAGIQFNFSPYAILAYAYGPYEVRIPWEGIVGDMNPKFRAALATVLPA
jgi:hypothetical protein